MKMKHFVLGLVFNSQQNKILLVEKKRPEWQAGFWNGIGGKIKIDESPIRTMDREALEETNHRYTFTHAITFVCPGGTVYVFKAICPNNQIAFAQTEDEELRIWPLYNLPTNMMANLNWMIPLAQSSIQLPIILQQNKLGVHY